MLYALKNINCEWNNGFVAKLWWTKSQFIRHLVPELADTYSTCRIIQREKYRSGAKWPQNAKGRTVLYSYLCSPDVKFKYTKTDVKTQYIHIIQHSYPGLELEY